MLVITEIHGLSLSNWQMGEISENENGGAYWHERRRKAGSAGW